ncbi:hypothetical protein [Paenibacillus senegalensis]|uniref:hypothetical protein n=1 Tax=Paenibacillus senegalensis TaxID=1465766 RepID=UPI000287B40E|nr:hypothetical protein [Paenibacillus senegalensis]
MTLTVTCRSRNRSSAITSDLQELNDFIKDQQKQGREVDLTDWDRFSRKLNAWRKQKKQVVS